MRSRCLAQCRLRLSVACFVIGLPAAAFAQPEPPGSAHTADGAAHFGAGIGLGVFTPAYTSSTLSGSPSLAASLYLPIDLAGVFRLEPELGWIHYAESVEDGDQARSSFVHPALGAFFLVGLDPDAQLYVGARGGPLITWSKVEDVTVSPTTGLTTTTTSSSRRVDGSFSPTVGGEYFFGSHFSLGAEVRLDFLVIGDSHHTVEPEPAVPLTDTKTSGFMSAAGAALFAHFFFF